MIGSVFDAWTQRPELREQARCDVARLGWSYVHRFASGWQPKDVLDLLGELSGQDIEQLRAFAFLGSDPVKALMRELPRLLRALPQAAVRRTRDVREIRGPVRWPDTTVLQARSGDQGRFIVVDQNRSHDLPENRSLVFVLGRMSAARRRSAKGVQTSLPDVEAYLRMPALSGITSGPALSGLDRQRLRASRNRRLRELVIPVLTAHDRLYQDDRTYLLSALSKRIWLPEGDARLYELWCLFRLVETLIQDGWQVSRMALLGSLSRGRPTFVMDREGVTVHVAFQTAPDSLVEHSRYGATLDAYGLSSGQRRPDIVISTPGAEPRHMIVEVKLTQDRTYITESIYKVLGYLADFSHGLRHSGEAAAVLVVWSGVNENVAAGQRFRIVTADGVDGGGLAKIVGRFADAS